MPETLTAAFFSGIMNHAEKRQGTVNRIRAENGAGM